MTLLFGILVLNFCSGNAEERKKIKKEKTDDFSVHYYKERNLKGYLPDLNEVSEISQREIGQIIKEEFENELTEEEVRILANTGEAYYKVYYKQLKNRNEVAPIFKYEYFRGVNLTCYAQYIYFQPEGTPSPQIKRIEVYAPGEKLLAYWDFIYDAVDRKQLIRCEPFHREYLNSDFPVPIL